MSEIKVVSKNTHKVLETVNDNKVVLHEASVVVLNINAGDVESIEKVGQNAVIKLHSGEVITLVNFFNTDGYDTDNSLVLNDEQQDLLWVQFTDANGMQLEHITFNAIESIEPLLYHDGAAVWGWWAVPLTIAGIIAWAGSSDKSSGSGSRIISDVAITEIEDDQLPVLGKIPNNGYTNDVSPLIKGSLTSALATGDKVIIFRDGVKVGEATVNGLNWQFQDNNLVDGQQYRYTAAVQDATGKMGVISNDFIINVDSTAPTQLVIDSVIDDVEYVTGSLNSGDATNDNIPTINGHGAEANATISLKDTAGNVIGTAVADAAGNWRIEPNTALPEGPITLQVTQTDKAGNESTPITFDLIIDTTAPTQSTVITDVMDNVGPVQGSVANNGYTDDTTPEIQGTISAVLAAGETVVVYRDGVKVGTATVTGTSWSFVDAGLLDGTQYQYTARVEDAAGNRGGTSNPYVIIVDATVPTQSVVIQSATDNVGPVQGDLSSGSTTDDSTPQLHGSVSAPLAANEVIVIYRDGVKVGTATIANGSTQWSYNDSGLNTGLHSYTAQVEDASGLTGPVSNQFDLNLVSNGSTNTAQITGIEDDQAPVLGNVTNGGYTNDVTPLLQGTLTTALAAGETVAVYRDGVKLGVATVAGTTWNYPDSGLVDGQQYTYTVAVENAAGIPGLESNAYTIHIDTTAPSQTVVITEIEDNKAPTTGVIANGGVTNDDTPEIKGTLSAALGAGEVVLVYRDGQVVGTATVTGTTWNYTDASLASGQTYHYTAQVQDLAGNTSALSNDYSIVTNFDGASQSASILRIIDDVDPIQGVVANNGATNDTTPTLEGSLDSALKAGDVLVIYRDGVEVGTATVNGTSWSYTDNLTADGSYTYTAAVRNSAGDMGAPSNAYGMILDTTAPTATSVIDSYSDDVDPLQGDFLSGSSTNDTTPTLNISVTGTVAADEVVAVYRDGIKVGTATLVAGTQYVFADSGLVDGTTYVYTTQVEDAAGNQGQASPDFTLTVDTTAPTQSTVITDVIDDVGPVQGSVANNGYTDDTTPEIQGTISAVLAAGETVVVYRDGVKVGTANVTGTSWNFVDSALLDGTQYQYSARVEDAAGNRGGMSNPYVINLDTTAPTQSITIDTVLDDVGPVQGPLSSGATTDDSTPQLNGSVSAPLAANEVVAIYRDGVKVGTATIASGSTQWSYTDGGLQSGSSYSYTAQVEDASGLTGPVSNAFDLTVDTNGSSNSAQITGVEDDQAPVLGNVANGGSTNDVTPLLQGTLTTALAAGETVAVYRDGVKIGVATVTGTTWSYPDSGLVDGQQYTYTVLVESAAGLPGAVSNPYVIHIDTTAPTQSIVITEVFDNKDAVTGIVADGGVTNDDTPEIKGTLSAALGAGEVVLVYRDGQVVGTATVTGTTWSYTDASLASGQTYHYTAQVQDLAGNTSALSNDYSIVTNFDGASQSASILRIVDDLDPIQGVVANNGATNDTTPTLEGSLDSALKAGDVVVIYRDGVEVGTATVNGTSWSYTDNLTADGSYTYTAAVRNSAGDMGAPSNAYGMILDTTAPTATSVIDSYSDDVDPLQGDFLSGSSTNDTTPTLNISVTGTVAADEVVAVYRDGVKVGTATLVAGNQYVFADTGLLNGSTYTYTTQVEDAAGNQGQASPDFTLTVDTTAPTQSTVITDVIDNVGPVQGSVANNGYTDDTTPDIQGTISAVLAAGETVGVYRDGVKVGTATVTGTSWNFTDSALLDGTQYQYSARVEDAAGNRGGMSNPYVINLDTTAPTQSITIDTVLDDVGPVQGPLANGATTDDSTPQLNGSVSAPLAANEVVAIYRDGVKVGTATIASGSTQWSYTDGGLQSGSSYSYTAQVEDASGLTGPVSNAFDLTIDTNGSTNTAQITGIEDDQAPVLGNVANGGHTNDVTPLLQGTLTTALAAGETVAVYRDGVKIGVATVTGTTWSYPDSGLVDGQQYTYTVLVESAAGLPGAVSNPYVIHIDTTAPTQSIVITEVFDNKDAVTGIVADGGVTNDDTPEIKGTLSAALGAGEVVLVYRDGQVVGTATVTGTTWSYTDASLASGQTYHYTAQVQDLAGNTSALSNDYSIVTNFDGASQSASILRIVDDVDPIQGVVANNGATNDTTPTLEGSLDSALKAGDVVVIYRDGVEVGTATVNGTSWSYTDNLTADGSYIYTAAVRNSAGDMGAPSNAYGMILDTTAPTATSVIDSYSDDVDPLQGDFLSGSSTNDTTPTLNISVTGTVAADEVVAVYRDGVKVGTATLVAGNQYVFADSGLVDGSSYVYTTQVEDAAGNQGQASPDFTLTVDTTAPTQSTVITDVMDNVGPVQGSVANNGYTDDTTPDIQGTISAVLGAGETVVIYRDGVKVGTATVIGTSWNFTDSALVDGTQYQYTARVEDAAGNRGGMSNPYVINLDTTAPTQSITIDTVLDDVGPVQGPLANGATTDDSTPQLNGSVSAPLAANEVVAIYRDGVKVGTATIASGSTQWSYTDGGLQSGSSYTYTAQVEDASGLTGPVSNAFDLTIDTNGSSNSAQITGIEDDQAPVLGNVANGGSTNDVTPLLQGTLSTALAAGETVAVYRDGVKIGVATVTGTTWSYPDSGLVDGQQYTYSVLVESAAGLPGAVSNPYVIHIDTTAPTQSIVITEVFDNKDAVTGIVANGGVTNDDTPEIKGTLSAALGAGEVVLVYRDGQVVGTATVTGTTWNYTDASLASGQTYHYTAQVQDLAGNTSALSNDYSIVTNFDGASQSASILRIIDDVDPIQGVVANNGATNDNTPTLEGSLDSALKAGDVVVIYRDGVEVGTATVNGTSWSYTDNLTADGSYTYTAAVRNSAGDIGAPSNAYGMILDTTAPTATTVIDSYTDDVDPLQGDFLSGSSTNDTTPTLNISVTGIVAADEVVAVYRDGVKVGTATLVAGTQYVFADTALVNGTTYVYTTQVEDAAGNAGTQSAPFNITVDTTAPTQSTVITDVIDNVGPVQGSVANNGYTDDTSPEVQGTISAVLGVGETVVVYRDGVKVGTATVTGTNWNFTDSALLDSTQYRYTARVEDAAGNRGGMSNPYVINLDATAPTQTVIIETVIDNVGPVQGPLTSGATTDDSTPQLNGSVSAPLAANEVLVIYRDGVKVGTATIASGSTQWSYTDGGLQSGSSYSYTAQVEDASGLTGPASNAFDLTLVTTGSSNTAQITGVEDDQAPVLGNVANGGHTNDVTPLLQGTLTTALAAGETVAVYRNGVKIGVATVTGTTWSYPDTGLVDGQQYSYTVAVENAAGLAGLESNAYVINIDTTAPSQTIVITEVFDNKDPVTGIIADGGVTNDDTPEIKGTLSAALGAGEVVLIYRDGQVVGTATVTGTTWSYTDASLASGQTYLYTAQVQDFAGNTSALSNNYSIVTNFDGASQSAVIFRILDNVDPNQGAIANNGYTNDTTPTLEGSLDSVLKAGDVLVIYRNGIEVGTATVNGTSWSYTDNLTADGSYIYTAAVRNSAGDMGAPSNAYGMILDTTAPTATTVIDSYTDNVDPLQGNFLSGSSTNDTTPSLNISVTGTVAADELVAVYRDGVKVGTATLVTGNQYVFTDSGLVDGTTYVYTSRVEDAAANQGVLSPAFNISVDTTAPTATTVIDSYTDDVGTQTGTFLSGTTTDDTAPALNITLTGTVAAGEVVAVYRDNIKVGIATLVAGNQYVFADSGLLDGSYVYYTRIEDAAGNLSANSPNFNLIVNTAGPVVAGLTSTVVMDVDTANGVSAAGLTSAIVAVNTDLISRDATPILSGQLNRALAAGETLEISTNGGVSWVTTTLVGLAWSDPTLHNFVVDTTLNVKLRVKDTAGMTADLVGQDRVIQIDLTTPNAVLTAPNVPNQTDATTVYSFNHTTYGVLEAGSTVALVDDVNNNAMWQEGIDKVLMYAVVNADGSWTLSGNLPAGSLHLGFMVWDAAGNISRISPITHVGTTPPVQFEVISTNWGGTTAANDTAALNLPVDGGSSFGGISVAALGMSSDGNWNFFQSVRAPDGTRAYAGRVYETHGTTYNSSYLIEPTIANGGGSLADHAYGGSITSAVFVDLNRDGLQDVITNISSYGNAGRVPYWIANADGTFSPHILNQGTTNHIGAAIAYDRTGDGYLDFILGDSASDSIMFITNNAGTLVAGTGAYATMPPSSVQTIQNGNATGSVTGTALPPTLSIFHELSAVDLDNNGAVDILANVSYNGTTNAGDGSKGLGVLYNGGNAGFSYINYANIFEGTSAVRDQPNTLMSMTYADFNGDGWLDLYMNRGQAHTGTNTAESRIYLNDGKGQLKATDADALWFGDNKQGGASFAVDWNLDGKMDVVEAPAQLKTAGNTITSGFATTLYLNDGTGVWGVNPVSMGSVYTNVTGAAAVDYDWDGSVDIILYHAGLDAAVGANDNAATSTLIRNTNIAADGTSLHVRIVDGLGINSYYGNTVKLYDSAGNLVATQVINPQSSASSNSTGIVNFYGLKASESYSVQLIRITNGVSDNVAGVAILDGYSNNTINSSWSGLKAGKANEAYVLTAEADTAVNDTTPVGIVGTGYNDHFFATLGNDHYNGGGGWETDATGAKVWVALGGEDYLDYSRLSSLGSISIDTAAGTVTKVIGGVTYTDTFENIERFVGSNADTIFNGSAKDEMFIGGSGNDTYNLGGVGGGSDTIYFKLLSATDATGGNGSDVANGFHIGKVGTDANADIINIHELLTAYTGTAGLYTDSDGVKLDIASKGLEQYLQISSDGINTSIAIDRDGGGDSFSTVLTLNAVQTDLVTLLLNNQLVI